MNRRLFLPNRYLLLAGLLLSGAGFLPAPPARADLLDIAQVPMFLGGSSTPLVMIVMGRDHKLYYEAYNDASDLNGDGVVDVGYKPNQIDYLGYFDSHKCYTTDNTVFTPVSTTLTKKCSGQWSGDFLNYVTTSRMDALKRVLYGGYRSKDDPTETILERSYIPQDAHSWGKEYQSAARDGYSITDYTPLQEPLQPANASDGKVRYHLFANTTPLCPGNYSDAACTSNPGLPLMRVVENSIYRVWEWVSIERPVAGYQCATGNNSRAVCVTGNVMGPWEKVPASALQGLSRTFYQTDTTKKYKDAQALDRTCDKSPLDHVSFENFENSCKKSGVSSTSTATGVSSVSQIDCATTSNNDGSCAPAFSRYPATGTITDYRYFMTIFSGTLIAPESNYFEFAADGGDAVELLVNNSETSGYYNSHNLCPVSNSKNCQTPLGGLTLSSGQTYGLKFRQQENTGIEGTVLYWRRATGVSRLTDYVVRVKACVTKDEANCRGYPADAPQYYKPAGLLQAYGEDNPERMAFGLLTGSYAKRMSGGVVRKNITPFSKTGDIVKNPDDEVNKATGQFITTTKGIVDTLNRLKIVDFSGTYQYGCGWITTRKITESDTCYMWGNPTGEMMYEALRYFAGKPSSSAPAATPDFTYTTGQDVTLGLPKPTWTYPFRKSAGGYSGAKCFELVISDVTPSYDSDQVPGTYSGFLKSGFSGDLNIDARNLADKIWANESDDNANNRKFIGESGTNISSAPTPKTVAGFGSIRGLPEEPTKEGSFNAAAVAYFGNVQGVGGTPGKQRVETLSVALASNLPRIVIPVAGGKTVTLVPFAKSVGGTGISALKTDFQPTDQIVDFYVEKLVNTGSLNRDLTDNGGRPHGIFRINYEDVEQGADHDMDAIVRYEFWLLDNNVVAVKLESQYAAGGIIQHMGYVISGTTQDGIYLEVRDSDTGATSDPDYYLDTPVATTTNQSDCLSLPDDPVPANQTVACRTLPPDQWASNFWQHQAVSTQPLTLKAARLFTPGDASAQYIQHDPLWYAAKWGGFNDVNNSGLPDPGEWDAQKTGTPDNYFLVTNASKLQEQLGKAFQAILSKRGSASVVAVSTGQAYGEGYLFQALYNSADWSGQVVAILPANLATGRLQGAETKWDAGMAINTQSETSRRILTYKPSASAGIPFRWPSNPASPTSSELDIVQSQALSPQNADSTYDYTVGKTRLAFLRGDNSNEGTNSGQFRQRSSDLGDIVNSSPVYVARPNFRYRDDLESVAYSTFRIAATNRDKMVYVGSNDGMLHGFSADDGTEKLAYVPSMVFLNLPRLTQQTYNTQAGATNTDPKNSIHRYFVDSSPVVGDVFFNGAWHSVLVGRLGAGGQGVFALDITDPSAFSESNAKGLLLWEFSDSNGANATEQAKHADLGYTFGKAAIAKMNNGKWAAIFGNGYNSAELDGHAGSNNGVLYIVDIQTGAIIQKIDTGVASGGLSSPYTYDKNSDSKVDWIYVGDAAGNLWKFDVSSATESDWVKPANVHLLFSAQVKAADGSTIKQSVTTTPITLENPAAGGLLIFFGTGRYLGNTDITNKESQAYYAIWDKEDAGPDQDWTTVADNVPFSAVSGRSVLLAQTFDSAPAYVGGNIYRTSSANSICFEGTTCVDKNGNTITGTHRGWYVDLPFSGERVYDDSVLTAGRIVFTSKAPVEQNQTEPDPCEPKPSSGKSWLNLLDAVSGSRLEESFITVSSTGEVTVMQTTDGAGNTIAPTSQQMDGLITGPNISPGKAGVDYIVVGDTDGNVSVFAIPTGSGRQSWRQIERSK